MDWANWLVIPLGWNYVKTVDCLPTSFVLMWYLFYLENGFIRMINACRLCWAHHWEKRLDFADSNVGRIDSNFYMLKVESKQSKVHYLGLFHCYEKPGSKVLPSPLASTSIPYQMYNDTWLPARLHSTFSQSATQTKNAIVAAAYSFLEQTQYILHSLQVLW